MLADLFSPDKVILIAIFLLVGFPVHEFAHALVAYRLGDATAKLFGRLTLNPIAHFDPIGGLLLVVSVLGGGSSSVGRNRHRSTRATCATGATERWPSHWRGLPQT